MSRVFFIYLLSIFAMVSTSSSLYGQFTIENSTSAQSIQTKPEMSIKNKYDIDVVNEALLKKQRKDEFNRKHYIEINSGLTVTQVGFNNWSAGGTNTFSGRVSFYGRHVYKEKKFSNDTYLNTAFGLGENSGKLWKTEDRLEINNALGYQMYRKWDYTMNVKFSSQFANGYATLNDAQPISHFLAPATLNVGVGFSYTRNAKCKISIMPVSGNITIVNDQRLADLGLYGVEPGKKTKSNVGALAQVIWEEPIVKNLLTYRTLASSFTDYSNVPNLNWQNWITIQVLKYLKVEFYCYVIYDNKIETPKGGFWQMNETLGVGLTYIFKNRPTL